MPNRMLTKVALHGVPRSGTSWIGEILNSSPYTIYRYQPLFSYGLKDFLTPASTKEDINDFFDLLYQKEDDFLNQTKKRSSGKFPVFKKETYTHIVYKEVRYINILFNLLRKLDDLYLCCVIRNPLSVINSWLKAPREFRGDLGWDELEEWRYALKKNLNKPEEFNGYEKWKEAALIFHRLKEQYPNRVHIMRYEDFLSMPIEQTKFLYESIGLELTESTIDFLSKSMNTENSDPYSVYRTNQNDNSWRMELNPHIAEGIQADLQGSELEIYIK
ncbi:sulfotransferase [Nitrosococcus wardiae]|uniref:Uncharacterized protein n=1 Tax=Nitrosococcus wardiae TaxID=1814290 RepID=A0A4P7BWN3_9GAMM|nr:sulfotransferase [Nitrosococcus wardiae]QBQ54493.1 hypothetical protein E3U44_08225 [Nitrosococcus wardiae]